MNTLADCRGILVIIDTRAHVELSTAKPWSGYSWDGKTGYDFCANDPCFNKPIGGDGRFCSRRCERNHVRKTHVVTHPKCKYKMGFKQQLVREVDTESAMKVSQRNEIPYTTLINWIRKKKRGELQ